jgi:hypothetical protein
MIDPADKARELDDGRQIDGVSWWSSLDEDDDYANYIDSLIDEEREREYEAGAE